MFSKLKESIHEMQNQTHELIDSNLAYYKLWVFRVITKSSSALFKILLIGVLLVIVFVFFSIAAAIAIGYALDNFALGFLIMGGFYLLVSLLIYVFRNKIERPIIEKLSEIFYNEED